MESMTEKQSTGSVFKDIRQFLVPYQEYTDRFTSGTMLPTDAGLCQHLLTEATTLRARLPEVKGKISNKDYSYAFHEMTSRIIFLRNSVAVDLDSDAKARTGAMVHTFAIQGAKFLEDFARYERESYEGGVIHYNADEAQRLTESVDYLIDQLNGIRSLLSQEKYSVAMHTLQQRKTALAKYAAAVRELQGTFGR